jgi:hypothetical protein
LELGEEDIAAVVPDPRSRDDIPQLLRGPQHIYTTTEVREQVIAILAELRPPGSGEDGKARPDTGRPGLSQWAILVLGALRLGLNADDDRILELANPVHHPAQDARPCRLGRRHALHPADA